MAFQCTRHMGVARQPHRADATRKLWHRCECRPKNIHILASTHWIFYILRFISKWQHIPIGSYRFHLTCKWIVSFVFRVSLFCSGVGKANGDVVHSSVHFWILVNYAVVSNFAECKCGTVWNDRLKGAVWIACWQNMWITRVFMTKNTDLMAWEWHRFMHGFATKIGTLFLVFKPISFRKKK